MEGGGCARGWGVSAQEREGVKRDLNALRLDSLGEF